MPISEEIARIIMTGGNSMDIAAQARREGVLDLRQSGLQGAARHHLARRSAGTTNE